MMMGEDLIRLYANALAVLLSFEKYWMLNNKSSGKIYKKEAKSEAIKICRCIDELIKYDKKIIDAKSLRISKKGGDKEITTLLSSLSEWGNNDEDFIKTDRKLISSGSRLYIQLLIMSLEAYLCGKLRLKESPTLCISGTETLFEQMISDWYGRVHQNAIENFTPSFVTEMNETNTLVIVSDIRRSQDLMTYSCCKDTYSKKMQEFTATCMQIIINNNGIFDKFTGDGFIAYFNESLSNQFKSDFYNDMLNACASIQKYAERFIDEWKNELRKIPAEPIGLSIGVDAGSIYFSQINHQVMAVGEPCIWASRLCDEGHKGEIILNNIPYREVIKIHPDFSFIERKGRTKSGEDFTCYVLKS